MNTGHKIDIRFGEVVASEANTMLTASAESNELIAQTILDKQIGNEFRGLTLAEACYLRDSLLGASDRVSQGVSRQVGLAFERAGEKLDFLIIATGEAQ